jgi:hypothetical protein
MKILLLKVVKKFSQAIMKDVQASNRSLQPSEENIQHL